MLRVPRSVRHSRVTQARLHELIVAKLYDSPLSTEAEVREVMAKDARLTRASVWQSRHMLAFGPRMHRSVAGRLLHAIQLPGCQRDLEQWLSQHRMAQHKARKPRRGNKPQRRMRQLDLRQLFEQISTPVTHPAEENGSVHAMSNHTRKRALGRAVGPGPHTYESVFGRRSYLVQLELRAVGGIVL